MDIDPDSLRGKEPREVIRDLIEHVTKTDEEISEKDTRGGKKTDLKLYITDNNEFEIGSLEETLDNITTDSTVKQGAKAFVANHIVQEEPLSDNISFVEIGTPDAGRTDEFVFIQNNGYLWILTTERKKWTKRTVEKLIKWLPDVERLYLSPNDLEDLVTGLEKTHVSGFTARYHSPYKKRKATLVFHGAEPNDLEKAKKTFQASPSRIEFDQANSPATAIQGANTNDGNITIESVRRGSQAKAVETLIGLSTGYQEHDRENYEIEHSPSIEFHDSGISVEGYTAIELVGPERDHAENLSAELEDEILSKNQYEYGHWDDDTFFVHDTDYGEVFEVALEPPNIVLYARETTTALSLRSFCQHVIDEFDSTYSIEKKQNRVSA